ncbi:hypothetical protein Syun_008033 [Stephania yunnanensis]|uniref:Uncharacterized protein n=1 Tax=Stephania yunnanensis TaxID=152371 RepID=A0AAP0PZ19_9MAGN
MVRYGYSPVERETTDFYKPSREDTKEDIEKLRIIVENQLGAFRPIVILWVSRDIVLWILKCDDGFNKRVEIENRWYDVIVGVKEAAINHAKSPLYGDEEVIGALFGAVPSFGCRSDKTRKKKVEEAREKAVFY